MTIKQIVNDCHTDIVNRYISDKSKSLEQHYNDYVNGSESFKCGLIAKELAKSLNIRGQ